jgi:hypothetical protein
MIEINDPVFQVREITTGFFNCFRIHPVNLLSLIFAPIIITF